MKRAELWSLLNDWLEPERFKDVAENGLQVEGKDEIKRVVCGVSANEKLIDAAIEREADAIFVHHGIVWGGGIRRLDGWLGNRVRKLMGAGINLFAYHLPLDAHPRLGNNAGLADVLELESRKAFGKYKGQEIGVAGKLPSPTSLADVIKTIADGIGDPLVSFGADSKEISTIGICSGGAPDLLYEAADLGLDLYLTGEVTEWVKAVSEESGVAFVAAGHHQTERFGANRICDALGQSGLEAEFVEVENPA